MVRSRILTRKYHTDARYAVGHVGLLERENASILNASIMTFAQRTIRSYKRAMKRLGLKCPLYLTQVRVLYLSYQFSNQDYIE